jgi:quinoprotein glucose dehydrogenase
MLYTTAGMRRAVVALDGATGEMRWLHSDDEGVRGTNAPRQGAGRGVAYWAGPNGSDRRIIYVTPGYRMKALDAATGAPISTFGRNGVVDLKLEADQEVDLDTSELGLNATPLVVGDVIVVGTAHRPGSAPRTMRNAKGSVRGYDARTGKRLWIFHTIPRRGEAGYETWLEGSAEYNGNTGVWAQMSADTELGLVYVPTEMPTGDYYGGNRPGDSLFADTLLALDVKTGKRKWHFQTVHHDVWDWDLPCAPILFDMRVGGRTVKAIAQPTKHAMLFVFNRESGEPIWPIEERPVPQGVTPGEKYSRTQPFPTRPIAYERQGLAVDDLIDFTPELRAEALKLIEKYKIGPVFTPPVVSKAEGPIATLAMSTQAPATNWPGGSFDPETHVLYVHSNAQVAQLGLVPPPEGAAPDVRFHQGTVLSGARRTGGSGSATTNAQGGNINGIDVRGLPIIKPPYGRIVAIDLNRGEHLWTAVNGDGPRNHPLLKDLNLPPLGTASRPTALVTKTLLFIGDGSNLFGGLHPSMWGRKFRAYDKATGTVVWEMELPAGTTSGPMTYIAKGKQFIVVPIGDREGAAEWIALALP